ncbi:rod shape-determining protein MreD [candidate division WOR-3 bacterium]|nr:rod shape-determining protein MreD [candidate division WOR-3 bacterium]
MTRLLELAVLYVLFLVQAWLAPFGPDLVLIFLLTLSLHEARLAATLLGAFAGLCLDLTNPSHLGTNIVAYSAIGYVTASLHGLVYRGRWYLVVLALLGLALRAGLHALSGAGLPAPMPLSVSAGLTVLLAVPADLVLGRVFGRRWTTG